MCEESRECTRAGGGPAVRSCPWRVRRVAHPQRYSETHIGAGCTADSRRVQTSIFKAEGPALDVSHAPHSARHDPFHSAFNLEFACVFGICYLVKHSNTFNCTQREIKREKRHATPRPRHAARRTRGSRQRPNGERESERKRNALPAPRRAAGGGAARLRTR